MARIKEVAARAGVSTATVSRTLKQPDVVSPQTRERVMAAVRSLGYTPNSMARNLRTLRSELVLVLVPDIGNPFFSEIIQGMEQIAHANGYSLLLGDTQGNAEREMQYAERVTARQADGLITLNGQIPFANYRERLKKGAGLPPIVNACEPASEPLVPHVGIDNREAASKAMQFLFELGHQRIGFVTGPMTSNLSKERLAGYRGALKAARIRADEQLIVSGDFTAESGSAATRVLLEMQRRPTAIFCSNDEMAIGAIKVLREQHVQVPAQMSVIGFDDIPLSRFFDPALTTILQPKISIGRRAMEVLTEVIAGKQQVTRSHILPFQLVVRDSTARAAK